MLSLPEEWQSITGGAIATRLYGQVSETARRQEVARRLVGACLDLAAEGISLRTQAPFAVEWLPGLRWRMRDYAYVYFPEINNRSLTRAIELGSHAFCGSIIVPPGHGEVLWRACQSVLGNRAPSILALDCLVDLRTIFTSADFNWTRGRAVTEILRRYNSRNPDTASDESVLVDIPPTIPARYDR